MVRLMLWIKAENSSYAGLQFLTANLRIKDMLTVTKDAVHNCPDHALPAVDSMFLLAKLLLPWPGL